MRIIAGDLKGRKISTKALPKRTRQLGVYLINGVLRPTSSKVREAVFNILAGEVKDSVFIDLYAGTGAVGMEAMSRGAGIVYFVESDKKSASKIEELLMDCGCKARAEIIRKNAGSFIRSATIKADIIFLDPPYYSDELEAALNLLAEGSLLKEGAVVMAEHLYSKKNLPVEAGVLMKKKTYRYGDTAITVYRKKQ